MAAPFSWSDTINIAFGSCLPCLKPKPPPEYEEEEAHNSAINRIPRARADELQGLLADPDTDVEAETMSLHSNPGRGGRRSKKKRRAKTQKDGTPRRITLFGYDLFGRQVPPIQLPAGDNDDALYNTGSSRLTPQTSTTTASTFDSDAAPLDAAAIAAMSSPTAIATAAAQAADAEAQRLREKEERRQRRREKKEMRRLAESLAARNLDGDGEDAFEGFQGSGSGVPPSRSGYPRIPNAMFPRGPLSDSGSGSASGFSGSAAASTEGFGRFVEAPVLPPPQVNEDDDGAADLDGGMYARRAPRPAPGAGGSNGSDSRSRTSASRSDRAHQFPDPRAVVAHIQSQAYSSRVSSPSPLQSQFQPHLFDSASSTSESFATAASNLTSVPGPKAKKSKSSSRTSRSHSSTTASQSPSLPSPATPTFASNPQDASVVSPSTVEQGQGFFDLEDEIPTSRPRKGSTAVKRDDIPQETSSFPVARLGGGAREGFPSTGFGGASGRARDFGVFLSRRGDDEVEERPVK